MEQLVRWVGEGLPGLQGHLGATSLTPSGTCLTVAPAPRLRWGPELGFTTSLTNDAGRHLLPKIRPSPEMGVFQCAQLENRLWFFIQMEEKVAPTSTCGPAPPEKWGVQEST